MSFRNEPQSVPEHIAHIYEMLRRLQLASPGQYLDHNELSGRESEEAHPQYLTEEDLPAPVTSHSHDGTGADAVVLQPDDNTPPADASGDNAVAVGPNAVASGLSDIAIGSNAEATGDSSLAIGDNADAVAYQSTAVGSGAYADSLSEDSIAIGSSVFVSSPRTIAIGRDMNLSTSDGDNIFIGNGASDDGVSAMQGAIAIGYQADVGFLGAIAIGGDPTYNGGAHVAYLFGIAIGAGAFTDDEGSIAIGSGGEFDSGARSTGGDGIAIGRSSDVSGADAIAVGHNAVSTFDNATALGPDAATTKADQLMLGTVGETVTHPGGVEYRVNPKSTNYTATRQDHYIPATAGAGGITQTLPAATGTGQVLIYKKIDSAAGAVTVARAGADTIDGATSVVLSAQYDSVTLIDAASGRWDII